jgi:hypothetical protein
MTSCLLISGLARHVEISYDNILKNIIEPNKPDVFIHTWLDTDINPGLDSTILNLYKPKKIVMEKGLSFNNTNLNMDRMMASYAKPYVRNSFVETFYSAWYSVQQSNIIKEQHRLENNLVYDYCIRARFDINYSIPIICENYDKNIIHLSNRDLPAEMIDDRFAFASNSIMNTYCSNFNFIDFIHEMKDKKDGIFCGETIVYEMCKMHNIKYSKIGNLHCSHVR